MLRWLSLTLLACASFGAAACPLCLGAYQSSPAEQLLDMPRAVLAQADELVAIPHTPQVESLNAGVAGSIVLYEAARQRRGQ